MLILGLLCMNFDAAVVFVTSQTLLFRLALAILCIQNGKKIVLSIGVQIINQEKDSRYLLTVRVSM